jgi:D-tyrosyl-tRNA(Tyr) deacylase
VVSQFTLYANLCKGNRPSWDRAGKPEHANRLYEYFIRYLEECGLTVAHGVFGADMVVKYENMGPVTIIADSDEILK